MKRLATLLAIELWLLQAAMVPPLRALELIEGQAPRAAHQQTRLPVGALLPAPLPPAADDLAPHRGPEVHGPDTALSRSATLTGRASWYRTPGLTAAAGPALRVGDWRGSLVRVSAGGRSVVVRLVDFCQCYRGERRERVIDLSDSAFTELAPLAVGIVRVQVTAVVPPATDTP